MPPAERSGAAPRFRSTGDERRAQLLGIAAEEFAEHGLFGTSMDVIARRSNSSESAVLRLFGSKKELFCEVVDDAFDRATSSMIEAAGEVRGIESLTPMGQEYSALMRDRHLLLLQVQAFAACSDAEVREVVQAAFQRLWTAVSEISGLDDLRVKTFLAHGMMLAMAAAMDVQSVDAEWARGIKSPVPLELYR